MKIKIRKILSYEEEVFIEGGKENQKILKLFSAFAVIENPWCHKGFVENLNKEITNFAPVLGKELTERILYLAKGKENIEAYGKAAMCGLDGEIEHASALIHTLRFGNIYRKALSAETYLCFTNTRSPANSSINIPLMHIHDTGKRSHYHTIQVSINDAPKNDEIVIALGAANHGRPHHRIGDRYKDLEELKK
tara:strand:+ start:589 stop:1167 length:579 start_codon:yes stop_codon:yes gene_type:complete